jgi:hypothetical protein
VNAADWAVLVSYAQRSSSDFSYGFSVKLIRRSLAEFTATGIGFDAGAFYLPTENLQVGAVLQDITTTLLAWSTGRTELITPTLRVGGAYIVSSGNFRIIPTVECAFRADSRGASSFASAGPISIDPYAGLEVGYSDVIALRGGVNEVGHMALGAGLRIKKLHIDYAFTGFTETSDLGASHRISLRIQIDSSL